MNRKERRAAGKQNRRAGKDKEPVTAISARTLSWCNARFAEALDHHQTGQWPAAEALYRQILAILPNHADTLHLLGVLHHQTGHHKEAVQSILQAIALVPDHAEAHNNLGNVYRHLGQMDAAEASFRQALRWMPEFPEAWNNLGGLLQELNRQDAAETAYQEALRVAPAYAEACFNYGNLLRDRDRLAEAEAAYRETLRLQPGFAEAWNNLGGLLKSLLRHAEAESAYRTALRLRPQDAKTLYNLGTLLKEMRHFDAAEGALREALHLEPERIEAVQNLGLLLLTRGDFAAGWPLYDRAFHGAGLAGLPWAAGLAMPPLWQGENLTGKSLLVVGEQGLGDEIQFCRYLPLLKAQGVRHLTLVCQEAVTGLLTTLAGVDQIVTPSQCLARKEILSSQDLGTFLLALPHQLGTTLATIPATIPYLHPQPDRLAHWAARLPPGRRRVGLVWKGSPLHEHDAHRSLPDLATLAPLWQVADVVFISLQMAADGDVITSTAPGQPLPGPGGRLADFADTAAIVTLLDLVITVDTAVAHLCGALGQPCWVLLSSIGTDWRWLTQRPDSPWYPKSMRLFRQEAWPDWSGVVEQLVAALETLSGNIQPGETHGRA
ncbi:MAG: tetratricopeptide repeat protein [Magnetococcus sp. DMHC-1]|nr:tetratricopeptide repeat protein [Magnetococcales bacterium]